MRMGQMLGSAACRANGVNCLAVRRQNKIWIARRLYQPSKCCCLWPFAKNEKANFRVNCYAEYISGPACCPLGHSNQCSAALVHVQDTGLSCHMMVQKRVQHGDIRAWQKHNLKPATAGQYDVCKRRALPVAHRIGRVCVQRLGSMKRNIGFDTAGGERADAPPVLKNGHHCAERTIRRAVNMGYHT